MLKTSPSNPRNILICAILIACTKIRVQDDSDKVSLHSSRVALFNSQLSAAQCCSPGFHKGAVQTDPKTDPYCFPGEAERDLHGLLDCELLAISISQEEHACFTATSSLPFWTTWYNLTKPFFIQFSCDSFPILLTLCKGMFWLLYYFMHCNSWTTF